MSDTFFLVFGIIVSLFGLLTLYVQIKNQVMCRERVTATIIKLHVSKVMLRGTTKQSYSPELSYTVNDHTVNVAAPFSSYNKDKYKVGETMPLYISKADPTAYRFPGKVGITITGFIVLAVGVLFIVLYFV